MLSRTADHLYWMSRYIERAESLARLVDAHYRMSLLPHAAEKLTASLRATMIALHVEHVYGDRHERIEPRAVFEFVALDRDFAGSILSCLRAARENARAVRGTLTSELWETLNSTWLEARSLAARGAARGGSGAGVEGGRGNCPPARGPPLNPPGRAGGARAARGGGRVDIGTFVEWVKERSHLTRGVSIGTMLRDEAFHFTRIGTFLERADSTARILTAHQGDLRPGAETVPDPYEWSVLLRALSAFEVYRRVYRDVIKPTKVAQLLILRADMPRSLIRCCKEVYQNLVAVANEQSAETERRAGEMHAMLHFTRMEDIVELGLPRFLAQFSDRLRDLGDRIASDFLVPPVEA